MKHLRHLTLFALLLCLIVRPTNGCSPGDPQAVFIRLAGPDAPYKTYAAGRLGVILPTYRPRHLVIAYNYLNGRPLTPDEQTQAGAAEHTIGWENYAPDLSAKPQPVAPGMQHWIAARTAILPGEYKAPDTSRQIPGDNYEYAPNCLDDAFLKAGMTLSSRAKAYGKTSAEVLDWLHAQDVVFSNCAEQGSLPQPASPAASPWLKQDRAYQLAAANFYATNYDAALAGFRAIGADHASPWANLAPYLVVRTLIRQTTFRAVPYGDDQKMAADKLRIHKGFVVALQQIDSILHDPTLKTIYPATQDLRDLVASRLEPEIQAQVLAKRLTSPAHGLDFRHNLVDLTYIFTNQPENAKIPAPRSDPSGLLAFLQIMTTPIAPPAVSGYESAPPETPAQTKARLTNQRNAAQTAHSQWQTSKKPAWLVAALTLAQPGDPFAPGLLDAARTIAPDSPAYTAATYHRLRLEPAVLTVHSQVATLLPAIEKTESRSSINLFAGLLTRTAPTLTEYLKTLPVLPASANFDGAYAKSSEIPTPQLCGPKLDPAQTPLFDENTATILNQRLPLRLLREAVLSETLPPNLRFQLANATLTRAVLLDDQATATAISPILGTCQAALKPWLDRYNAAKTPDERHLQGLFLLMRFPSAEPLVRTGNERSTGFATYSELRDNWWSGNEQYFDPPASPAASPAASQNPSKYVAVSGPELKNVVPESPGFKPALFSVPIVSTKAIASPPFLTASDATEAAREIFVLQHLPGAGDYFANNALAWVKLHPTDPNNAELLGFATRVLRNSPRSANATELNHQLFNLIHRKYPSSTWAKRYTTWE
jgi:hypothetical protein